MSALEDTCPDTSGRDNLRVMTISHATDLWLGELERMGKSPRTITTYRRLLDKLAGEYGRIDVEELTLTQVRRFLDARARSERGERHAAATIAQQVSIVNRFFDWIAREGIVKHNPTRRNGDRIIFRPKQVAPEENDNVTTISSSDVGKLLEAADLSGEWSKRIAVNALVYLGPRRRALAQVRISDYDPEARTLSFHEKGDKKIRKPVPDRLAELIEGALAAGIYTSPDDYLVPSRGRLLRTDERDDRVIWNIVRDVAADAGVKTHVHALRAAFAVHFLERKPGELIALKDLMGHRKIETTLVYLRRLDRTRSMETVRDLDWTTFPQAAPAVTNPPRDGDLGAPLPVRHRGEAMTAQNRGRVGRVRSIVAPHSSMQFAAKPMEASVGTEKEGFEPSFDTRLGAIRAGIERQADVPGTDLWV